MLSELIVSQFAIIDHIHIQFEKGLNILSGETGAGKSILIKSLALLMGAKSSQQDIRSNEDVATIQGAFDLSDRQDIVEKLKSMGIDSADENLIVRRLLYRSGKSKVYLNGQLSTVADLREVVFPLVTLSNPTDAPLIEITGQHENKDLMSARYQMDILDQFCGNLDLRLQIETVFGELKDVGRKIQDLQSQSQFREQQIDFLAFQIREIESLDLLEREDEVLKEKIKGIKQQGQWRKWIRETDEILQSSDSSLLTQLKSVMLQTPDHASLKEIRSLFEQTYTLLEEAGYQLQRLANKDFEGEDSLEELEDRLSRIRKLQKKFGAEVADILSSLTHLKAEHFNLVHLSESIGQLQTEEKRLMAQLLKLSGQLSLKRKSGSQQLAEEVNRELRDLNMKGLDFLIGVEGLDEPHSTGMDRVVFRTKTGKKDDARDLAKTASGGELSRILLSLKQVIGANQFPRTFLFDEVDTGVSGPTAEKVGAKLQNLAKHQQVICVTHLPQVACFGDHHYYIEKEPNKDTVEMSVKLLNKNDRIQEIARLISGETLSKTSIAHAKQLLASRTPTKTTTLPLP